MRRSVAFQFEELTKLDFSRSMNNAVCSSQGFGIDMTRAQQEGLLAVLKKYSGVFPMKGNQLSSRLLIGHQNNTWDASSVKENLGPFFLKQRKISKQMHDLLKL